MTFEVYRSLKETDLIHAEGYQNNIVSCPDVRRITLVSDIALSFFISNRFISS